MGWDGDGDGGWLCVVSTNHPTPPTPPTHLLLTPQPPTHQHTPPPPIHNNTSQPQIGREYPLNLSILISGGKETNRDSLSNGERSGNSSNLKSETPFQNGFSNCSLPIGSCRHSIHSLPRPSLLSTISSRLVVERGARGSS